MIGLSINLSFNRLNACKQYVSKLNGVSFSNSWVNGRVILEKSLMKRLWNTVCPKKLRWLLPTQGVVVSQWILSSLYLPIFLVLKSYTPTLYLAGPQSDTFPNSTLNWSLLSARILFPSYGGTHKKSYQNLRNHPWILPLYLRSSSKNGHHASIKDGRGVTQSERHPPMNKRSISGHCLLLVFLGSINLQVS